MGDEFAREWEDSINFYAPIAEHDEELDHPDLSLRRGKTGHVVHNNSDDDDEEPRPPQKRALAVKSPASDTITTPADRTVADPREADFLEAWEQSLASEPNEPGIDDDGSDAEWEDGPDESVDSKEDEEQYAASDKDLAEVIASTTTGSPFLSNSSTAPQSSTKTILTSSRSCGTTSQPFGISKQSSHQPAGSSIISLRRLTSRSTSSRQRTSRQFPSHRRGLKENWIQIW